MSKLEDIQNKDTLLLEFFKTKIEEKAKEVGLTFDIGWHFQIDSKGNVQMNSNKKHFQVVVNKAPSVSVGGIINQAININILCYEDALTSVFQIFELLQLETLNKKFYLDNYLLKLALGTPAISENFISVGFGKASTIQVIGSCVIADNIMDIKAIKIFGEEIPILTSEEVLTGVVTAPQLVNETLAKVLINGSNYQIVIRVPSKNNTLGNIVRSMIKGKTSQAETIEVEFVYDDDDIDTRNMIITQATRSSGQADIPMLSVTLADKFTL